MLGLESDQVRSIQRQSEEPQVQAHEGFAHAIGSPVRFECVCDLIAQNTRRHLKTSATGHFLFLLALASSLLFTLVSLVSQSPFWIALSLTCMFTVSFFFFITRIYQQARLPEVLGSLRDEFIASCRQMLQYRDGDVQHHRHLAEMLTLLEKRLRGLDRQIWTFPKERLFSNQVAPIFAQAGALLVWPLLHGLRQLLLLSAIDEYIKQIQCDPVNLSSHADLALGYVRLCSLYNDPRKKVGADFFIDKEEADEPLPFNQNFAKYKKRFTLCANRAIEEFKIIAQLAPQDPWVHRKLALCYCDLEMHTEEIKEHEKVLQLCPDDDATCFRLGVLYFQQGRNADGLRIYHHLLENQYPKVHQLLSFYEAYRTARSLDPFEV